jgi:hypothetical protein
MILPYYSKLKPEPEREHDPKVRNCLSCLRPFTSEWAGERICPKCKSSASWRSGSAPHWIMGSKR